MKGPERIETARLVLRKPELRDAEAIFGRYANDAGVTRHLGWARHRSIEATRGFLVFSAGEWLRWPAGPYLIESQDGETLLGGTGLAFESTTVASTGYVLARDAWGCGFATEALGAMVILARELGVRKLYALCHRDNSRSVRVLAKCGFAIDLEAPAPTRFPNLSLTRDSGERECLCFTRVWSPSDNASHAPDESPLRTQKMQG